MSVAKPNWLGSRNNRGSRMKAMAECTVMMREEIESA
jgi:hypothetical protein